LGRNPHLQVSHPDEHVFLDAATVRNLELTAPSSGSARSPSLLDVLDHTETAMGARLLRRWLLSPLRSADAIRARLEAVRELLASPLRTQIRKSLRRMGDLERMVGRAGHGSANARDLLGLAQTLEQVERVAQLATSFSSPLLREICSRLDDHRALREEIARALVPEPPPTVREGGLIREGYDPELDEMRDAAREAKEWLAALEARERERTGIRTLKVGYNKVFGYYIEVTKPYLDRVPPEYEPRQTLVGAQRYVTPQMKEKEALILHAHERMCEREYELFCRLRDQAAASSPSLLDCAAATAALDALSSLAEAAERYGYVEPELVEDQVLEVEGGRHPVVEQALRGQGFVPNDLLMNGDRKIAIVTGPNFAGKSTYLRQNALIVLMAHVGSFVPAKRARIGLVDRIFTRVGASDDIASGRSTFLVEMQETANILHNATPRSLVLLDEVGRGTATYDGLSIAWAVVEYLWKHVRCRTLFATHYHELTELADRLPGVFNLNVLVREEGGRIVFLHRVAEGASDRSYGIHVARLAGLPEEAVERARQILETLEPRGRRPVEEALGPLARRRKVVQMGLPLVVPSPVEEEIASLDLASMTPVEAMYRLWELQEKVRRKRGSERTAGGRSDNL
jgi:DNA mismatch repair protein MutS